MLGLVRRLKNGDFILKSKMMEPNQNKKLNKPLDCSDAIWKIYFNSEINKSQIHIHMCFRCSAESLFEKYKTIHRKNAKLVLFEVQHIFV